MINTTMGHIYKVFIGSPSDLGDERKLARQIIERVNQTLSGAKFNWRIELLAWEDTLPGYARPQEIINQEVDNCNLFLGLLWKRWGSPTGKFSSGFEEEFNRARNKRLTSSEPEIWIFLKTIEKDQLEDPGEQLQKTVQFRKWLQESREVLYKEFSTADEWEDIFHDMLLQHVLRIISDTQVIETKNAIPNSSSNITSQIIEENPDSSIAQELSLPNDLVQAIDQIKNSFQGNVSIEQANISRLYLMASTLMSSHTTETLGNHEINSIYLFREKYKLLSAEKSLIFRSIIADQYNYKPGWYWQQDLLEGNYKNELFFYAIYDANIIVRKKCIEVLSDLNLSEDPPFFSRETLFQTLLQDDNQEIVNLTLSYLEKTGNAQEIHFLDERINPEIKTQRKAFSTKLALLASKDINLAFETALNTPELQLSDWPLAFEEKENEINTSLLIKGLSYSDKHIRLFAAKQLYKRNQINLSQAAILKQDKWPPLRAIGYKTLIGLGEHVESDEINGAFKEAEVDRETKLLYPAWISESAGKVDKNEILLNIYDNYSKESLDEIIIQSFWEGYIAYEAMARKYFNELSERIQSDLKTGFKDLLDNQVKQLRENIGDTANEVIDFLQGSGGKYILNRYISSSLLVIVEKNASGFIDIARTYLFSESDLVKYYAVQIISKWGSIEDVDNLVTTAKQSTGELKVLAAEVALSLSSKKDDLLRSFLLSKNVDLIKASFSTLMKQENVKEILADLLYSDHNLTRAVSICYAIQHLNKEELLDLLNVYLKEKIYYYDVVYWLDMALYAPEKLSSIYIKRLESSIKSKTKNTY